MEPFFNMIMKLAFYKQWWKGFLLRSQSVKLTLLLVLPKSQLILVPRGRAPFGQQQESRPLASSNGIPFLNGFVHNRLRPEPIRFVRLDSEHVQSDGKSVNRGLPVLDLARGWPEVAILGADQKERGLWGRE